MGAVSATTGLDVTAGLIRSAALIHDVHAAVSGEHGLTPQQAQLMCVVGDQPSSMVQLGALLRIGKSSMTGLIDRAQRAGLVQRVPAPDDGRSFLIEPTPLGRRTNEGFRRAVGQRLDEVMATLTTQERDTLAAVLSKIVLNNQAPETWPEQ
nr:MarR family transcriptional regulator [Ornithinimicrobium cryptoxanthini]